MKKIRWIGPDRLIPPYGAIQPGDERELPDAVADSFVAQKLAKAAGKVTERTVKSNVELEDK